MALEVTFEDQQVLAETLVRSRSRMTPRERLAETIVGATVVGAIVAIWLIDPPHGIRVLPVVLTMFVMGIAIHVRFETPFGFTAATQLAFVPLLFAVPVALAGPAIIVTLAIGMLPETVGGPTRMGALLAVPANACFAVGPSLVFALAGSTPSSAGPLLLLAAFAGQLGADFAGSTVYHAIARKASVRSQLRESWVYLIDAALTGVGLAIAEELGTAPFAVLSLIPLLCLLAVFAHERNRRLTGLLELGDTYRGTARLLGHVIAADDRYTGEHSQGVVDIALAIGEQLELPPDRIRNLEFSALLHDVGKITIPKQIVNKPERLDAAEWELMKAHTIAGQQMLDLVGGFMREVGQIVRSHHERFDGTGYPDGLAGQAIPLEARIIACADTWHAMRTDRPYRAALPFEEAARQLLAEAGSHFDPAVVAALSAVIESRGNLTRSPADGQPGRGSARRELIGDVGLAGPA